MRLVLFGILLLSFCFAIADAPFPDTTRNHWVYTSMIQMKKNKMWYRAADNVPKRKVRTRNDFATKTLFLAIDSPNLVNSFKRTAEIVGLPADDAATKKWAKKYRASFPMKKVMYQNHVRSVIKLWNFFRPEIKELGKTLKIDVGTVGTTLLREQKVLNGIRLNTSAENGIRLSKP